ncbi:MAG: DUF4258 domain-containing protein [Bacteroidota bacterium]|jgi:hypothetical protein|nr:DUF4258 domain-containing protein [Bacteroidota bacterium]MDP3915541.1 DUF4258 domain-containing protein [Bacteroidota bacterium]
MDCKTIHFSGHAIAQMFKRNISVEEIEFVIRNGKIIKEYPEDKPYVSQLLIGIFNSRVLHVVASGDKIGNCYVITAYHPDINLWNSDFTSKK